MAATQFCQEQKTDLGNNVFILLSVPACRIMQYMFVLVTYKYLYRATEVVTVPQEESDPHSVEITLSPHPRLFSFSFGSTLLFSLLGTSFCSVLTMAKIQQTPSPIPKLRPG